MKGRKPGPASPEEKPARLVTPGVKGWPGRGGGAAGAIHAPALWRGTTVQVCGLWPFAAGAGAPIEGAPVGHHLDTGAVVCCDPISWFQRSAFIANPSAFILGKPGLGKSTLARRMVTFLAAVGVVPFVLGDVKPDYVDLIRAMGGQVIELSPGRGALNVLDLGEAVDGAARLTAAGLTREAETMLADARTRRASMLSALLTIARKEPPNDREENILGEALRWLDRNLDGTPVMQDLLETVRRAPIEVREVALDRGDLGQYRRITEGLEASLMGLCGSGRLGDMFALPTTNPMRRDRPVVFDVSSIGDSDEDLQAAALMASWTAGFGTVNVAQALADSGLEPRRHYIVVSDELWRALRLGHGMVQRYDSISRLNRTIGVGKIDLSHTVKDLVSMTDVSDQQKAKALIENSGMVILGGLPQEEMPRLEGIVHLSKAEQQRITSWSSPPAFGSRTVDARPPGQGNFLIKVGERPGIPVHLNMTESERAVNDTNARWHTESRVA
ncbi:MAG: ATP/GTP-binding protein [Propionibacteriaceae bacterium]|jgi:hypothetical protein|nr:ATP/GTP-binding protein [Propionibacteriaceae bacterium]